MNELEGILKIRFDSIEKRIELVLNQLDNQQVNWRPNESSNSIANLIVHMSGNINERIGKGMNEKPYFRNRDEEFGEQFKTKDELIEMILISLHEVKDTLMAMSEKRFSDTKIPDNRDLTNLEIFIQTATHISEHTGQIFYIAKMLKDEDYVTTIVPKQKPKL
ncbi:DUF1572 domain-containing protein [Paenibacillus sp. 5J-6]|uniref:DUF1572 domain-containing protein n=1 Tax=Paenibacillus silvestris TaxID=2606219 RepID=A0A6L8USH5_9BACL|nr:DUF1572 family protein [Paenibacillus silvestris]MZQ81035.1 DUF1572 domain-containing protein [Paenibacillus silvestris]